MSISDAVGGATAISLAGLVFTAVGTGADLAPFVAVMVLTDGHRGCGRARVTAYRALNPAWMAGVSEGRFSAEEITEAYAAMHARVQQYAATGEWDEFADNFTDDAEYVEHAFGTFRGRDEIRAWSVPTMTTFPGGVMTGFPLAWQVVDAPSSRLICEVRNLMPDPGDGTHGSRSRT